MGNSRWKSYRLNYLETDLWIAASTDRYNPEAEKYSLDRVIFYRKILDEHIKEYPVFLSSLTPLLYKPDVHPLIRNMYVASERAGTGPMSSVAGAMAEFICNDLVSGFGFSEVVVENGGDIFMNLSQPSIISIYAGDSPLSDKIGLVIKPEQTPVSVCCSSGTVGHSLSFGIADACVIACSSGAQADAYATACCNEVKSKSMLKEVTEMMLLKEDIISVVIIKDDKVSIGGKIEVTLI